MILYPWQTLSHLSQRALLPAKHWTRTCRALLYSTGSGSLTSSSLSPVHPHGGRNRTAHPARAARRPEPSSSPRPLPPPTVLFSNNHLLVVNKPPGWISSPNGSTNDIGNDDDVSGGGGTSDASSISSSPNSHDPKCLLTYLRKRQLGGGSQRTFLLPIHRLDQPCSGVQLYAKTRRAATKIQSNWQIAVRKSYVAVLNSPHALKRLLMKEAESAGRRGRASAGLAEEDNHVESPWIELRAYLDRKQRRWRQSASHDDIARSSSEHATSSSTHGWSVTMIPVSDPDANNNRFNDEVPQRYRLCTIQIQPLRGERGCIRIVTKDGARHVIRALLACHGAPLAGDARYGRNRDGRFLLPDWSVALHAERIEIVPPPAPQSPANSHSLLHSLRGPFVAPTPPTWEKWFGIHL